MAHADPTGKRCTGRSVWRWGIRQHGRGNFCNLCGVYEPNKLPKLPAPKKRAARAKENK